MARDHMVLLLDTAARVELRHGVDGGTDAVKRAHVIVFEIVARRSEAQ